MPAWLAAQVEDAARKRGISVDQCAEMLLELAIECVRAQGGFSVKGKWHEWSPHSEALFKRLERRQADRDTRKLLG